MPNNSIRTIVKGLALVLAFGVGVACGDLEEALLKEECFSDADCGGKLDCVIANPNGINTTLIGWCLEEAVCINGEQPYCPCSPDPASSTPRCATPYDYNRWVQATVPCWDGVDMNSCLCLPPEVTCEYDM
jgi:hypothetical protein